MRQIVLDTETTGLETSDGHRIIEIGCVEVINRRTTGNDYHCYLNPDRLIDEGAFEVHGISNEFVADKPRFADIVDDLQQFLDGAELIIHNAPFDVGFLNHELSLLGDGRPTIEDRCTITDSLELARRLHPGQRNNLDALCKRYDIDNSQREKHGALLDAEILADVFLAMTGGQSALALDAEQDESNSTTTRRAVARENIQLRVIRASDDELARHDAQLQTINKASGGQCRWLSSQPGETSGAL